MAEVTILGQPLKFWAEDNILQVSAKKLGRDAESPTLREVFAEFVTHAYQQEETVLDLTRGNRELKEGGRELAGRLEISTFDVELRNEILGVSPEDLGGYIARLGVALEELQATDVPDGEVEAGKRQTGIEKLQVKLAVAEGSMKVIGPFLEQLAKTTAAVERGTEVLATEKERFGEEAQVLQDRIGALERDGIPAHQDEIHRLTQALLEKTEAFNELGLTHQELVRSAREAEDQLGGRVKDLGGQVEEALRAQEVAVLALDEQQRVNDELKVEHTRVLREAGDAAVLRERALREELEALREDNGLLTDRVRVLGEVPGAYVRDKAAMLERVAVVVLGAGPDFGQVEARVGELMQAEGRLGQLYDLAHIPRDGGAFNALVGMIQAVARIFTTLGRGDVVSLAVYAGHIEPHVADINRKAGDYAGVVLARDNAVQDLAREQAESKKLLSILGNGFSWTWNAATVVPSYIYDAMRF